MLETKMEKQLNIVVLSTGGLQLEWQETSASVSKSQKLVEEKIYSNFTKDNDLGIFSLGVSDKSIALSSSLEFWRNFAHEFTEKIRLNPDIESLRENAKIECSDDFFVKMRMESPFTQGAEYIDVDLLRKYWSRLILFFMKEIETFKGSVEHFFHLFSPNIHLIGRIYFHLVENKNESESPFAF